jgi:hypothetical protein
MNQQLNNISKLFVAAAMIASAASAPAAGWGSIKGKFVIDGAAPKLAAIDATAGWLTSSCS